MYNKELLNTIVIFNRYCPEISCILSSLCLNYHFLGRHKSVVDPLIGSLSLYGLMAVNSPSDQ